MLARSFTAVLEKNSVFTSGFATEPYEAGWAHEARWFVRVLEMDGGDATLSLTPEVSPDGLFWCAEGTRVEAIRAPSLYSFALRDFGQWLRLRADLTGPGARVRVLIYLALKE